MRSILPIFFVTLLFGCSGQAGENTSGSSSLALSAGLGRTPSSTEQTAGAKGPISTFLTFQDGNAEAAMNFYVSLFDHSKIIDIQRYGEGGPAKAGTIMMATFELNGSRFACSDSYAKHAWGFTPAVSNWVECQSEEEIKTLLEQLSEDGKVLMPLDNYGFSSQFAFVEDRFGVSWQLNLQ